MRDDVYSLGKCLLCNKEAALKNSKCTNCQDNSDNFIDFFNGIINKNKEQ